MSRIREYLEEGRAGKIYDPNQGMYMDPETKQAFVPTFTNRPESNIMNRVQGPEGYSMNQGQGAYLVHDRPGPGAMPGRGGEGRQAPDPRDPWSMANEHMKNPQTKIELFQQMFPGRNPQGGFQSEQERNLYFKGLQSYRNALVDRFKWQITQKDKREVDARKGAARRISQAELMKQIGELTNQYREANESARLGGEPEPYQDPAKQAEDDIFNRLQSIEKRFGQEWDNQGQGMPVEKGASTIDTGATAGKPQGEPVMQIDKTEPAAPTQEGKTFQEWIKEDKNKGQNAFMNVIEEMNIRYPDKSSEEINQLARDRAKQPLPDYYTWDKKQFSSRIKKLLGEESKRETKEVSKQAVSNYYQGGTAALI